MEESWERDRAISSWFSGEGMWGSVGGGRWSLWGLGPSCRLEVLGGCGRGCGDSSSGGLMFVVVTVVGERERSGEGVAVVGVVCVAAVN